MNNKEIEATEAKELVNREISIPEILMVAIDKNSTEILSKVNSLEIKNIDDENMMLSFMLSAKKSIKNLKEVVLGELNKVTKEDRKKYLKLESNLISPYQEIAYNGDIKLKKWLDDKEAKRIGDQKIADDKAEADRKKEEERVAKCQSKAEAKGKVSTASERVVPDIILKKKEATTKGASYIDKWFAVVTDPKAVLEEVLAGRLPITVVEFKMPILNNLAKAHQCESAYKGVVFKKTQTITQRTK